MKARFTSAKSQNAGGVSVKYLEQLIIPLKKAGLIKSVRGPKGGHMPTRPPDKITVGEVVSVLEGGVDLTACLGDSSICDRSEECLIRSTWAEASKAMYKKLNSVTLHKIIKSKMQC